MLLQLGPSAFFLPLGGINSSHYDAANKLLSAFDLAIPLENLTVAGSAWFRVVLGWSGALPKANTHRRKRRNPASPAADSSNGGAAAAVAASDKSSAASAHGSGHGRRLGRSTTGTADRSVTHPTRLGERSLRVLRALNKYDAKLVDQARARFARQVEALRRERREASSEAAVGADEAPAAYACQRQQCPAAKRVSKSVS